jgi:hypothetical protein
LSLDKFGVLKKYETKLNGEEWFMNTTNILADPRVLPSSSITSSHVKMNPDGSFKVTQTGDVDNRFNILTTGGYNHSKCVLDWNVLKQRGYMQNPQDWRNVEITGYVRINKVYSVSGHSLVWYARGGHHSTSYPCEGSAYKGNVKYDGNTRFQKEQGHPNYFTTSNVATALSGKILGKWFGYKFCCYDVSNGVKLENWLDLNLDNNWIKVLEKTDTTGWGNNPSHCGGTADQKFVWGGPQAVFRFDSALDIDFAKLSVREITTVTPTSTSTPTPTTNLYDDFSTTYSLAEGATSPNGKWKADFLSGGFAKTDGKGLIISPAGPDLRSVQVKSLQQWGDARFTFDITTEKQVVTSGVQPWMCGWILFRHLDKWRHYYVVVKPNGIEFGKKDAPTTITNQAEIEKYQKILWTGGPSTPVGTKRNIQVETKGDRFTITVDGTAVMVKDDVSSFKSGSLSPYAEGSQARYGPIKVEVL